MHKYLKPSSSAVSSLGGNWNFEPVKYHFADFFYNGGTRLPSVYETFSNICHSAWALKFNGAFGKRFVFFWGGGGVEAEWDAFVRDKFFAKEARTISLIPLTDKICK